MNSKFSKKLGQRAKSERGASLAEYALLLALIVCIAVPSVSHVGAGTTDTMGTVGEALRTPVRGEDLKPACHNGAGLCK